MSLIIYTKIGCAWCEEALQFLSANNVAYEEREVRGNEAYLKELEEKSGQTKTPTLDLDGDILSDTDAAAIALWLKEKGVLQ
jgi:glutaredoxin